MKKILIPILTISALAFLDLGCSEADRTFDCADICGKYEECVEDEFDNSECIDTCEDKADNDEDFEEKVDECENCLDSTSCAEATAKCTDECAVVVAESMD